MAKPKTNSSGKGGRRDQCQTPFYALDPILPYLKDNYETIWEPAAGEGNLARALETAPNCHTVIASDILPSTQIGPTVVPHRSFLTWSPGLDYHCIVTNPPYSSSLKYKFIRRAYELDQPFAFLVQVDTLGSKQYQEMCQHYGYGWLMLDNRINYKMPEKGWRGQGATFASIWITWRIPGLSGVRFGHIEVRDPHKTLDGKILPPTKIIQRIK